MAGHSTTIYSNQVTRKPCMMDGVTNFYIVDKFEIFTACTLNACTVLDVPGPCCVSIFGYIRQTL